MFTAAQNGRFEISFVNFTQIDCPVHIRHTSWQLMSPRMEHEHMLQQLWVYIIYTFLAGCWKLKTSKPATSQPAAKNQNSSSQPASKNQARWSVIASCLSFDIPINDPKSYKSFRPTSTLGSTLFLLVVQPAFWLSPVLFWVSPKPVLRF